VLFDGRSELDQIDKIFKLLGSPNEKIWHGLSKLPAAGKASFNPPSKGGSSPRCLPHSCALVERELDRARDVCVHQRPIPGAQPSSPFH